RKKITKFLKASKIDREVGIRFPPSALCRKILDHYDDVVLSSHITPEMLGLEEGEDIYSILIEEHFPHLIDLIIDPEEIHFLGSTTVVDFTSGAPVVQRVGMGNPEIFI